METPPTLSDAQLLLVHKKPRNMFIIRRRNPYLTTHPRPQGRHDASPSFSKTTQWIESGFKRRKRRQAETLLCDVIMAAGMPPSTSAVANPAAAVLQLLNCADPNKRRNCCRPLQRAQDAPNGCCVLLQRSHAAGNAAAAVCSQNQRVRKQLAGSGDTGQLPHAGRNAAV